MSLLDRLKAQIAQDGPIGVPEFFTRCLHDPRDGYYATRPGGLGGGPASGAVSGNAAATSSPRRWSARCSAS
jgi:hypothetical protein